MLVFFSDIYGLNEGKKRYYEDHFNCPIEFVSPYDDVNTQHIERNYRSFCDNVGMQRYCQIVERKLSQFTERPFLAIGESVGATALWCNTPKLNSKQCMAALCLHGSRIREHLDVQPNCPTKILFSRDEDYFLTATIKAQLTAKAYVRLDCVDQPHGFASPTHEHFDADAFVEALSFIEQYIDN